MDFQFSHLPHQRRVSNVQFFSYLNNSTVIEIHIWKTKKIDIHENPKIHMRKCNINIRSRLIISTICGRVDEESELVDRHICVTVCIPSSHEDHMPFLAPRIKVMIPPLVSTWTVLQSVSVPPYRMLH